MGEKNINSVKLAEVDVMAFVRVGFCTHHVPQTHVERELRMPAARLSQSRLRTDAGQGQLAPSSLVAPARAGRPAPLPPRGTSEGQ